jgi:hypothetical protein
MNKLLIAFLATAQMAATGFTYGQNVELLPSAEKIRDSDGTRKVRIDIAICLDSTGSMGDEIDVVKSKLRDMVTRISSGSPKPDVRFGIVTYRDRGDEYVTKKWNFSRDMEKVRNDIATIQADGGGDGPESVNEGLHVAVEELDWDTAPGVERLIYLIGDAPPHFYADDYAWRDEVKAALTRRISIHTVGCSGINDYGADDGGSALTVWQEMARRTEGRFDYLSYFNEEGGKTYLTEGPKRFEVAKAYRNQWKEGGARLVALGGAKYIGPGGSVSGENNLDHVLAAGAQNAAQKSGTTYSSDVSKPILGRTIARGGDRAARKTATYVLTSEAQWQEFWKVHDPRHGAPKIDFSKEIVVAVAQNGASVAEVTAAARIGEQTLVSFRQNGKASHDVKSAYHIVALPRKAATADVRVAKLD